MKTFKKIEDWLSTNPTEEETKKVLSLINRGVFHRMRREVYEKEAYRRKLVNLTKKMDDLELPLPGEYKETIDKLTKEIEAMKKELPKPVKREKKEVKEEPKK